MVHVTQLTPFLPSFFLLPACQSTLWFLLLKKTFIFELEPVLEQFLLHSKVGGGGAVSSHPPPLLCTHAQPPRSPLPPGGSTLGTVHEPSLRCRAEESHCPKNHLGVTCSCPPFPTPSDPWFSYCLGGFAFSGMPRRWVKPHGVWLFQSACVTRRQAPQVSLRHFMATL